MLFEEVFNKSVDIPRPTEFCENKDANLLALLRQQFGGRCLDDAYVVSVDKVLVSSDVTLTDGVHGTLSVRFTATVDRYQKGTIVSGCEVEETVGNNVKYRHPRIIVVAAATRTHPKLGLIDMSMFPKGLSLPMLIVKATSMPNDVNLIAQGELYIPKAASFRLAPVGEIHTAQLTALIELATRAEAEVKALAKAHRFEFFEELLYPYTTDREMEVDRTRRHSVINIARGMVDVADKHIIFDARIRWAVTPYVVVEPAAPGDARQMGAHQIMVSLLTNYISHAQLLADMVKRYEPEETFRKHAPLWGLMGQAKT